MRSRTDPGISVSDLVLVLPQIVNQIFDLRRGKIFARDDGHRPLVDKADGLEIFDRVVRKLAVKARRGRMTDVMQKQSVAIRSGPGYACRADGASRTTDIFYDDLLLECPGHRLGD